MKRSLIAVTLVALGGCANAETGDGNGGSGGAGSSTLSVSSVSTTESVSSTAAGSACAQDCSTVEVPACYAATCNADTGACDIHAATDGTACEDGEFCTVDDKCESGLCKAGDPRVCDAEDECAGQKCDEASNSCIPDPKPDQTPCTPTSLCAQTALCIGGQCLDAGTKDCSSFTDECNVGVCDDATGDCSAMPTHEGQACTTGGSFCEIDKVCTSGVCVGTSTGLTEVMASGTGLPMAIPDNNTTGITNAVSVAQTGTIAKLAIDVDITHTYDADVLLKITPPTGAAITLLQDIGPSSDNFTGTELATDATTPIASGTAPYTGKFVPVQSILPLLGTSVTGTWTLKASDDSSSDTGTLNSWSLHACVQ